MDVDRAMELLRATASGQQLEALATGQQLEALATVARKMSEQAGRIVDAEECVRAQAAMLEDLTGVPAKRPEYQAHPGYSTPPCSTP